jgi:hypothetical protein
VYPYAFWPDAQPVSVVPGEATVETSLTKSQSELRLASNAYCDEVVSAGWVEEADGLASLADTLMHGKTEIAGAAGYYATRVGAETKAPALVLARIVSDSQDARARACRCHRRGRDRAQEPGQERLQSRGRDEL